MLSSASSDLSVSSRFHVNGVDDVEELLYHGNLLVNKVNLAINCLQQDKNEIRKH